MSGRGRPLGRPPKCPRTKGTSYDGKLRNSRAPSTRNTRSLSPPSGKGAKQPLKMRKKGKTPRFQDNPSAPEIVEFHTTLNSPVLSPVQKEANGIVSEPKAFKDENESDLSRLLAEKLTNLASINVKVISKKSAQPTVSNLVLSALESVDCDHKIVAEKVQSFLQHDVKFDGDFYQRLANFVCKDLKIHQNGEGSIEPDFEDDMESSRNLDGNVDLEEKKQESSKSEPIHTDSEKIIREFAKEETEGQASESECFVRVADSEEGTIIIVNDNEKITEDDNAVVMRVKEPGELSQPTQDVYSYEETKEAKSLRKVRRPGVDVPLNVSIDDAGSQATLRSPSLLMKATNISSPPLAYFKRAAVAMSPTILSKSDAELAAYAVDSMNNANVIVTAEAATVAATAAAIPSSDHSSLKTVIRLPKTTSKKKGKRKHAEDDNEADVKRKREEVEVTGRETPQTEQNHDEEKPLPE